MELTEAKVTAVITLGLSTLLVGLLPAWFSTHGRQQWPLFLSLLLCFGGGVLMSTSLIHMLPEIREAMPNEYQSYTELIFCIGFFIVYVIDEIVHYLCGDIHNSDTITSHNNCQNNPKTLQRRHSYGHLRRSGYGITEHHSLLHGDSNCRQFPYNPNYPGVSSSSSNTTWENYPPSQLCHVGHQEPCDASSIGNVGLLIALCIHALLEGLAIGLQTSSTQVILLLGAVASHKLVVGFCLGVELSSGANGFRCRHIISILVFSLGSVVGIVIGMAVVEIPKNILQIVFPVMQGLAAGTLLYVTVSEVLPRERARWHKQYQQKFAGVLQLIAVIIGFAIMTTITLVLEHHHN